MSAEDWYAEDAATFGDRLAAARETAGLTQAKLAARLGVKTGTIRDWEDDLKEPRANRIQMLCGMLNVSMAWLLTGIGDGVDGPLDENVDADHDLRVVLAEMRSVRAEMTTSLERLARLEKRLRKTLETPND